MEYRETLDSLLFKLSLGSDTENTKQRCTEEDWFADHEECEDIMEQAAEHNARSQGH